MDIGKIRTYFSEKQLAEWEQMAIQYNRGHEK
jgi:hypothetical protein